MKEAPRRSLGTTLNQRCRLAFTLSSSLLPAICNKRTRVVRCSTLQGESIQRLSPSPAISQRHYARFTWDANHRKSEAAPGQRRKRRDFLLPRPAKAVAALSRSASPHNGSILTFQKDSLADDRRTRRLLARLLTVARRSLGG